MTKHIMKITLLAMLSAISIVMVAFIRIPIIPIAPFLEYDMSDVPVILSSLIFGTIPGLSVLFITSVVQAFIFGGNGWVGILMHFVSSSILLVFASEFYKHKKKFNSLVVGMALGTLALTLIMVPMNYLVTVNFYGLPKEAVDAILFTAIVPFNLIKAAANSIITVIVFKSILPFINRYI